MPQDSLKSYELTVFFSSCKMFLVALSTCCQKLLVIQIVRTTDIRNYRKYQHLGEMVLYLLTNGYNGMYLTFRNGLIDSFEVFHLCTGSLTICAQAHH